MRNSTITILNDSHQFSGISQYTEDLIYILISNGYNVKYVSYYPYESKYRNIRTIKLPVAFGNFKFGSNLRLITCSYFFQFRKFIMEPAHITSQFLMPLGMGKKNIAITIHDLNQIHKTGIDFISTGFMDIKLSLLNRYQKITVVSNFVKQDVLNHFRVDENLIQVLYNWIDLSKIMVQDLSTKRKDSEIITLIHVGNDQPNKNINLIYRLLNYLPATYYLIRVGSNSKRNLRYVEKNGLRKRIKFYQGISKEKLGELYNFADIFIYPSTNEGFGRPLLEAMAHGLPIIYRNSSSLPEIAGSAGLSFESDDLEEISEKIKMVAEYKNYRLLAQKSLERSKFFDISNQKSKILRFYRELLDWT